jgi:hypothetical protein
MITIKSYSVEDKEAWENFVKGHPDAFIQHRADYRDVLNTQLHYSSHGSLHYRGGFTLNYLAAWDNDKIVGVLPAVIYNGEWGSIWQSLPYGAGYAGVLADEKGKFNIYKLLFGRAMEIAKDKHCKFMTICTRPLSMDNGWYEQIKRPEFKYDNIYQWQSLDTHPLEQVDKSRRDKLKNDIKNAENAKVKIIFADCFEEWWERVVIRRGKTNFGVEKEFIRMMLRRFPDEVFGVYARNRTSKVVAGAIFVKEKNILHYYWSDQNEGGKEVNAMTAILNEVFKKYVGKVKFFNWQSSPKPLGGVYEYKKHWGAKDDIHSYLVYQLSDDIEDFEFAPLLQIKEKYPGYFIIPKVD